MSERFIFADSSNITDLYLRNSWLWTFPKYPTVDWAGGCGVVAVRADDMLGDNIFFLIKMPLEFVEFSRVNVEEDNISLTAADVDSFDVAMQIERQHSVERWAESKGRDKMLESWQIMYVCD